MKAAVTTAPVRKRSAAQAVDAPDAARMKRVLIFIAATTALAAIAWLFDQKLTNALTHIQPRIAPLLNGVGALGGLVLLITILASFPNWRRLIIGLVAPLALSGLLTNVLKWVIGRARPELLLGPWRFAPLEFKWEGQFESFPSGHTTTAVALALLLGIYFPRARWVFYVYAALVGLDRVIHNRHYTSDVLFGCTMGALGVYLCWRLLGPSFYCTELPAPALRSAAPATRANSPGTARTRTGAAVRLPLPFRRGAWLQSSRR
jgi:membrane-associated phospholipid phosphatase